MQKSVVHLQGDPDIGKTGLLRSVCPPMLAPFMIDGYTLGRDVNASQAKLIGKGYVIMDDFTGALPRDISISEFNGFITSENPNIDVKYIAPKNYPRTAWLCANGTSFYCPRERGASDADRQGFNRRFLVTPCETAEQAKAMEPGERVAAVRRYGEAVSKRAMAGAYLQRRRCPAAIDPSFDPSLMGDMIAAVSSFVFPRIHRALQGYLPPIEETGDGA